MKFLRWAACLLPLFLAACGGGGGTTTTTCTIIGTPRVSYTAPGAVALGGTVTLTQNAINNVQAPCSLEYTASNLPTGLSINAATGQISGTVTAAGTTTTLVQASARGTSGGAVSGSGSITFVVVGPVAWEVKTSNHGIGSLRSPNLAAIGNTLYAIGSQQVGNNFLPLMYQSLDAGVTWTNTNTPPTGFTSLRYFKVVSDNASLYLVGGRTSDATVTSAAAFTYNPDVLKFTPGSPGAWTTISSNPFSTAAAPNGGREDLALAWDATSFTLYVHGGLRGNSVANAVYRSSNRGVSWTLVNDLSSYSLFGHCMMASGSSLFVVGGMGFSPTATTIAEYPQVLKSTNGGVTWNLVASTRPVPGKALYASCAANNGRLYVAGGLSLNPSGYSGDVLQSLDNGTTWNADPASALVGPRADHSMAALNGKLLIFGGENSLGPRTDVISGTP
jgi:hypothetical protein